MSRQLQVASNLKMRALIRFLCTKRWYCCEIYQQFHEVFGENAMSRQAIPKWYDMLENRRTNIDYTEHERRLSTKTNSEIIAQCTNECMFANRPFIVRFSRVWSHKRWTFETTTPLGWRVESCNPRVVIAHWTRFLWRRYREICIMFQ